jgi:mono/diheme cytochrome c family protein
MKKTITFGFFSLLILFLHLPVSLWASVDHPVHSENKMQGDHWVAPHQEAMRPNPRQSTPESIHRGADLFKTYCAICHGVSAKGDGPAAEGMRPKPADLTAMAGKHKDGDIAWKIATGKGPMPDWQKVLNKNQIWDVVNFIQNLDKIHAEEHNHEHYSR